MSPVRVGDSTCPFCDASQRTSGAPSWILVSALVGLGLGPVACDGDDGTTDSGSATASTTAATTTTTTDSTTDDSTTTTTTTNPTTDTTTSASGTTYAGPAESDSAWGDDEPPQVQPADLDPDQIVNDGHQGRLKVATGRDSAAH